MAGLAWLPLFWSWPGLPGCVALPEGDFEALPFCAPRDDPGRGPLPVLVRRVYPKPIPLPPRPHHLRDDGWLVRDVKDGAVRRLVGPFVVGGGWWAAPIQREYHYAETVRGDLLWVFHDPLRRRWFLEGQVE